MSMDGLPLTLRPATAKDLDFAWFLYRELMKPLTEEVMIWHDINQRRVVESDMAGGEASIILMAGDKAGWFSHREEVKFVRLCQLYVVPEKQNQGIGSAIVRRLMAEARDRGKPLVLEVMKNNRAGILYERLGFTVTGDSKFKFEMMFRPGD